MKTIYHYGATLGPIGYAPAPGSCASMVTAFIIYVLSRICCITMTTTCVLALTIVSWYIITKALYTSIGKDPSYIVLDEVVGTCCTFLAINPDWFLLLVGLLIFRTLDIGKPWPLDYLQRLHGAWGILADDIGAGLISNGVLCLFIMIRG